MTISNTGIPRNSKAINSSHSTSFLGRFDKTVRSQQSQKLLVMRARRKAERPELNALQTAAALGEFTKAIIKLEDSKTTRGLTPTLEREGAPGLGWSISCERFERPKRHTQAVHSSFGRCDVRVIDNVADSEEPVTGPEPVFGLYQTPKVLVAA